MTTVDFRSRFDGATKVLDPDAFVDEYASDLDGPWNVEAGRSAVRLGLAPLALDVEGDVLTLEPGANGLRIHGAGGGALVVAMDRNAFSELMQDAASTFGLQMTGRADIQRGDVDAFLAWEPVLRCLLDQRPVYEQGTIEFRDPGGAPLELRRSFTLDDRAEDMGDFLAEAGFLHVVGVFTEPEMAQVSAELDEAIAVAERDDGASWWARTQNGEWFPSRILGFNQKSPSLRALLRDERFTRLGALTDDRYVQRDPDIGDSAEGLLKKVGVVEGISDVSWHKDCAMGGHSRHCCGLTVGISVTGAGRENGELGVVAGSHRANVGLLGIDGLDLPQLPLPTRTGDITVHCSCTLHMSRQPVSAERRVVYTGFGLAPRPGDHKIEKTHEQIRRERAALNDHVRERQERGVLGGTAARSKRLPSS
jgi:Phytanoyl-CoA dioxygenase (PhyH)